jgi:glutamyl-tRNA synthetase
MSRAVVRGRYAPSPTGELHLGNASTALLAWLSVRSRGGCFVMRVEDLDPGRSRADLARGILADLAWLGLDWDEGPDVGGPHEPYLQSRRAALHDQAFERLRERGLVYPCFCSRNDVRAAASAPHGASAGYPGTCRTRDRQELERRLAAGERHAWRFGVEPGARAPFVDRVHGVQRGEIVGGDFVVRRSDGVAAYQLAVVVDDAAMEIDEVVRGEDLLPSTPLQLLLIDALGLERPSWAHVPLLHGPDGARLSKRHRGITLCELRERGMTAERIVGRLAGLLGLRPDEGPVTPRALALDFDWTRFRPPSGGIPVDPGQP